MIGISPNDFWDMSINEITMAINGFQEYNTGKKGQSVMTIDDLDELKERYPDY